MTFSKVFYDSAGTLHAPWRILLFLLFAFGATTAAAGLAGPLITLLFEAAGIHGVSNAEWVQLIGLLAATALSLRWVDKRSWQDVWLNRDAGRPSLLVFGFVLGALAIGLPILGLLASHLLRESASALGSWAGAALRVSLFLLPAAFCEELLTRGYILSVMTTTWGWAAGVGVTSLVFGLLHLQNPGATVISVALVTLAGFFLAAVLYVTRSLYAAWMAHFAWNWTMAVLFHASVSGLPVQSPNYQLVDAGPAWATGGPWGPEGGLPAGAGMAAGIGYLLARRTRKPRPAD